MNWVFYIPEDDILHSHRRENLKSYIIQLLPIYLILPASLGPGAYSGPNRNDYQKEK
jgi:hypothetical protein